MDVTVPLDRTLFGISERTILSGDEWTVTAWRYPTGIESLEIRNARGRLEVLPYMGQIIWDAEFDGQSLRMQNMFDMPHPATTITETYGCFAFHSGLLANGCPSPQDDHPLHGEFPCARMDRAELVITDGSITVRSVYEYVMGFGHHYRAIPTVRLDAGSAMFTIGLEVTNLSAYADMPLQYMCHMNYRFLDGARMTQDLPEGSFRLRETVPAHVTPTPAWTALNDRIRAGEVDPDSLVGAEESDPEIVYFADDLPRGTGPIRFEMASNDEFRFVTEFDPDQLPVATRWILWNPDQKVAAFVLPGTSRPEGFIAARDAGTLISLPAGHTRRFEVRTGLESAHDTKKRGDAL